MGLALTADDRLGIHDLYARYAWGLDTMDVELYLSTFADDGRFNSYQGHDQLRENFNRVISADQWPRPQHYNGQLLFLEGDSRRCRLKSYSTIIYRLGDGRVNFRHLGLCRDTCLNLGDRWVFEERLWEVWDAEKVADFAR